MEDQIKKLEKEIEKLKDDIKLLQERRTGQTDYLPDSVKSRHVGEGVRFIRSGATASKPATGESTLQGSAIYYDETTNTLYIYNNTTGAWFSEVFS